MILEDHDIERLAEAVAQKIPDLFSSAKSGGEMYFKRPEAAEYLRCSTQSIDRLVKRGELEVYRPAGVPLFKRSDLDDLVHQTKGA